jgi:hypothetical protein
MVMTNTKLVFRKKPYDSPFMFERFVYQSQLVDPLDAAMPYQVHIYKYKPGVIKGGKYEVVAAHTWLEVEPVQGCLTDGDDLKSFTRLADAKAAAQKHIDALAEIG